MYKLEIKKNCKNITLLGNKLNIEKEKNIIENLELTGNESVDRLIIQKCIDDNKLKSKIMYDGNTVYPLEKIVKAYRKLQKSGSLEGLSKEMYHFFMYACNDIAHYDIEGYVQYYDFSIRNLENELMKTCWSSNRFSDINRIFKELKIGKEYFKERENININNISLKELKNIIQECGWNIKEKTDNYIEIYKEFSNDINYSFDIDILNSDTDKIIRTINYISYSFNTDYYIEKMVMERKNDNPSISNIVSVANSIKFALNKLYSDVLYKTRVMSEEKYMKNNKEQNKDYLDYDY